jgi:hypothetical protein
MSGEIQSKRLDDLSFDDLYVEPSERIYSGLKVHVGAIVGWLHIKRVGMRISNIRNRLLHASLFLRTRANH